MSRKNAVLGAVAVGVAALTLIVLAATGRPTRTPQLDPVPYWERIADRTTPRLARMSPAQRAHARILGNEFRSPVRVLDELSSVKTGEAIGFSTGPASAAPRFTDLITGVACKAEAVLVGRVVSSESLPVENGTFLFTEYDVRVGAVYRLSSGTPTIQSQDIITIVRPGGTITVDGERVSAIRPAFPALVGNRLFLFFLTRIPETNAFRSQQYPVFEIRGSHAVSVGPLDAADADLSGTGVENNRMQSVLRALSCSH